MANVVIVDDAVDNKATHEFSSLFLDATVYNYDVRIDHCCEEYQVVEIRPTGDTPYLLGFNIPDNVKAEISRWSGLEFRI